jgi:hypothetical protein
MVEEASEADRSANAAPRLQVLSRPGKAPCAGPPSASNVEASPFRSPRGLDGAEQCVVTARPSRVM